MKRKSRTCIGLIKLRDGRLMMAGDHRVSESFSSAYKCPFPKVRKKENGMLMGASGHSALCKFIVDVFEPPAIETDLDTYMFHPFQKALYKALRDQPGKSDEHHILRLAPDTSCAVLIGIENRGFIVDISNETENTPLDHYYGGEISIDDVPIPFVIGCGSTPAFPILYTTKTKHNTNTKAQLIQAMTAAAELSPGCDDDFTFITTD